MRQQRTVFIEHLERLSRRAWNFTASGTPAARHRARSIGKVQSRVDRAFQSVNRTLDGIRITLRHAFSNLSQPTGTFPEEIPMISRNSSWSPPTLSSIAPRSNASGGLREEVDRASKPICPPFLANQCPHGYGITSEEHWVVGDEHFTQTIHAPPPRVSPNGTGKRLWRREAKLT